MVATKPELKPPLYAVKLAPGHEDDEALLQSELARTDRPAMGWVEKLWRDGPKLMADVGDVPDVVARLIKSGAYKKVSAEIYPDLEYQGRHYGPTLRRIGVLGAEIPAVKTLADIPTPARGRIEGLEVFQAGEHQGRFWTLSDIDAVVGNFQRLNGGAVAHAEGRRTVVIFHEARSTMVATARRKLTQSEQHKVWGIVNQMSDVAGSHVFERRRKQTHMSFAESATDSGAKIKGLAEQAMAMIADLPEGDPVRAQVMQAIEVLSKAVEGSTPKQA